MLPERDKSSATPRDSLHGALWVAFLVLAVAALYLGRELLIPLALAAFVSFLLAPATRLVERFLGGRVFSVLVVVGMAGIAVGLLGWIVVDQAGEVARDFTRYRTRVIEKVRSLRATLVGATAPLSEAINAISAEVENGGRPGAEPREGGERPAASAADNDDEKPVPVEIVERRNGTTAWLQDVLNPLMYPVATFSVAAAFVVFFLIYREDLRDRVIRLCGMARVHITTTALEDSARRIMRYLGALALANAMIGLMIGIGLWTFGIPNAALWGFLAAVLRFVPYVGAFAAGLFPVAQAVAISDGWWQPLGILGWIIAIDLLSANLVEPWLFGSRTGVAPTALLFAFVFWTWLWGGIGLLLATPLTVCLIVVGRHVPRLEVFSILFGDEPALEPRVQFFQRLLARDRADAERLWRAGLRERSPLEACDQLLLPALAEFEADRRRGLIDGERVAFARRLAAELIDQAVEWARGTARGSDNDAETAPSPSEMPEATAGRSPASPVTLVLGSGAFDELLPKLLAVCAPAAHFETVSGHPLATELVARLDSQPAGLIVLATIGAKRPARFRLVLKRLRRDPHEARPVLAVLGSRPRRVRVANQRVHSVQALAARIRAVAGPRRPRLAAGDPPGPALEAAGA